MGLPPAAYECLHCSSAQRDSLALDKATRLAGVRLGAMMFCPTCESVCEFPARDPRHPLNPAPAVRTIARGREVRELAGEVAALAGDALDAMLATTDEKTRWLLRTRTVVDALRPAFAGGARLRVEVIALDLAGTHFCEAASAFPAAEPLPRKLPVRRIAAGVPLAPAAVPGAAVMGVGLTGLVFTVEGSTGAHDVPPDLLRVR